MNHMRPGQKVPCVPVKTIFDEDASGDRAHILSPGMSVEPKVYMYGAGI